MSIVSCQVVGGKEHTAGISLSLETAKDTGPPSVVFDLDTAFSGDGKRGSERSNASKGVGESTAKFSVYHTKWLYKIRRAQC